MSPKKIDFNELGQRERPSVVRRFMSTDETGEAAPTEQTTVVDIAPPETQKIQESAGADYSENGNTSAEDKQNPRVNGDGAVARGTMATSPAGRKYFFYNTLEDTAITEIETTIRHIDICKCDKCFSDMCSIVLNNLKPHYVTTTLGGLFDRASLLNVDTLSKISVEIFKAIEIVKNNPSH